MQHNGARLFAIIPVFGQLGIVLGFGRLAACSNDTISPIGVIDNLTNVCHLLLGEHLRDFQEHDGVLSEDQNL